MLGLATCDSLHSISYRRQVKENLLKQSVDLDFASDAEVHTSINHHGDNKSRR